MVFPIFGGSSHDLPISMVFSIAISRFPDFPMIFQRFPKTFHIFPCISHRCPSFGYSMALFSARSSRHSPGATSGSTTSASLRHGKNAGMWKNTWTTTGTCDEDDDEHDDHDYDHDDHDDDHDHGYDCDYDYDVVAAVVAAAIVIVIVVVVGNLLADLTINGVSPREIIRELLWLLPFSDILIYIYTHYVYIYIWCVCIHMYTDNIDTNSLGDPSGIFIRRIAASYLGVQHHGPSVALKFQKPWVVTTVMPIALVYDTKTTSRSWDG